MKAPTASEEATRLADEIMGLGIGAEFMACWKRARLVLQRLIDQRDAASADAALAWRRVTELQVRGTQLVEELRRLRGHAVSLGHEYRHVGTAHEEEWVRVK